MTYVVQKRILMDAGYDRLVEEERQRLFTMLVVAEDSQQALNVQRTNYFLKTVWYLCVFAHTPKKGSA